MLSSCQRGLTQSASSLLLKLPLLSSRHTDMQWISTSASALASMRLFVGNLSFKTTENTLRDYFSQFGTVQDVSMPIHRDTGRPRGFAFVTLADESEGQRAIEEANGRELDGRPLRINEAQANPAGGAGRARSGGGYGGGGYGGDRRGPTNEF